MSVFSNEIDAALVAVVAGLGTYFLQIRWTSSREVRNMRRIVRRLLEAHSDAEAVFNYLDHLCEAVTKRGRIRLSTLVIECAIRDSCERLARIDRHCVFHVSEFLASLEVFERGLRRLEEFLSQFVETYPEDGAVSARHQYVRRLICGQAQILKKDRVMALKAEIDLLNAMPNRSPEDFMTAARKGQLLEELTKRADAAPNSNTQSHPQALPTPV